MGHAFHLFIHVLLFCYTQRLRLSFVGVQTQANIHNDFFFYFQLHFRKHYSTFLYYEQSADMHSPSSCAIHAANNFIRRALR